MVMLVGMAAVLVLATGQPPEGDELIWAAGDGDATRVRELLAAGAPTSARSKDGESALHVSAIKGDLETVRQLIAAGAEVDARTPPGVTLYMTPSQWATYHGHTEVVKMLLDAGADPEAANEHGKTLLEMAREAQQPAIEQLLRAAINGRKT